MLRTSLCGPWGGRAVLALLAGTSLTSGGFAQQAAPAPVAATTEDATIIVTATRRAENLQDVPISITAFSTETLDNLQVQNFDDYARYLPSLSYQSAGPGFARLYFRGVANGENGNHSAQLPSVGTYLDDQPVTTIQGPLDIQIYDIERIEALAGPQGTLYGASSLAGTVRIITNKPDTKGTYGAVDLEVNKVTDGGVGYVAQGFVNLRLSDRMALRVVGWYDHSAGYIDNIAGERVFPTFGPGFDIPGVNVVNNDAFVEDDYNDVDTYGLRAALRIELDDRWTVTPSIMGQITDANGSFFQELGAGDWNTVQYNKEDGEDRWFQAGLAIEGKVGSFDINYSGSYMERDTPSNTDYSDYAYYYDALFGYGAYYVDDAGNPLSNQRVRSKSGYSKMSHELRFAGESGPASYVFGFFYQRQTHNINENYIIDGLNDGLAFSSSGINRLGVPFVSIDKPDNIWLTRQYRVDRDWAAFGEFTMNVTDKLALLGGARVYKYKNSLVGFFGYNENFSSSTGINACFGEAQVGGSPCTNLDKTVDGAGVIPKLNATYKWTDDVMTYFTWSKGFRPGGVNRRGTLPPYDADTVTNYELGFKTAWLDRRLTVNGAFYLLKWNDIQFSYLGANGLTEIRNAGNAEIKGFEFDVTARPVEGLTLQFSGSYNDAELTTDYCRVATADFDCTFPPGNSLLAPAGTRLPITPPFKANARARYEFGLGEGLDAHLQAAAIYTGEVVYDLRTLRPDGTEGERTMLGGEDSYITVDLSAGLRFGSGVSAEVYVTNLLNENANVFRSAQCAVATCANPFTDPPGVAYGYPIKPRQMGLKLGKRF